MVLAAVGQLCSTASMAHNLSQCQILVKKAVAAGAKALFLPEASDYIASNATETISLALPARTSPFVLGLQHEASQNNLPINVGIHEPAEDNSPRVKNTLIWISASGAITHRYQKLHLFDVSIPPPGPTLRESASVEPGAALTAPFPTPLGHCGLLICFDLRFPAPSTRLRARGAHILTYPSAFTVPTGKAHWETLLRARAVENQCYVVASAQVGRHNETRVSYGRSMLVDPWGGVVAEAGGVEEWEASNPGGQPGGGEPRLVVGEVDLEALEKVRREMPLRARTDVVDVVER